MCRDESTGIRRLSFYPAVKYYLPEFNYGNNFNSNRSDNTPYAVGGHSRYVHQGYPQLLPDRRGSHTQLPRSDNRAFHFTYQNIVRQNGNCCRHTY